jgi:serine/threonine protein kinase
VRGYPSGVKDPPVKGDLQAGDTLGPYRLEEKRGEGAMGCVFLARHEDSDTPVALKLIRVELAHDARYRQRFLHEARAASAVDHRHLVKVVDVGEIDGRQYLAMRFVRGPSLEQHVREAGPLTAAEVVRIATEMGGAIDALHAAGLVHRDIKSSNIMLDEDDDRAAALTDFGLAKGAGYRPLTRPGQILGTLDYIAPERIRGDDASPASDIYGLGCVLYECVAGKPPFASQAAAPMAAAFAHLEAEPEDPCMRRSDLAAPFGAAVTRALAKDPGDRPSSGARYADLLRTACAG